MNQKPTQIYSVKQKDLWQAQMLEFFHNYFIGISNLECSNEKCPLVENWNSLETCQTKKGKAVLVKIASDKFITANLLNYDLNDLEEVSNVEIQFKSGKTQRTKPITFQEPNNSTNSPLPPPYSKLVEVDKPQQAKEIFLKEEDIVCFFNNSQHLPNLLDAETIYLNDLWEIKEKIKWDQKASKKKIINWVEQKVDGDDQAYKIDEWEKDYIFNIYNPDITNEIKAHEVYQGKDSKEREQLWADFDKGFSELRRVYGIRHLTSKKEDRQNNPEIELNEAQFIALERNKRREREKSIKECEEKGFCAGIHILTYGTSFETRKEKGLEVKEIQEQTEDKRQSVRKALSESKEEDKEKEQGKYSGEVIKPHYGD